MMMMQGRLEVVGSAPRQSQCDVSVAAAVDYYYYYWSILINLCRCNCSCLNCPADWDCSRAAPGWSCCVRRARGRNQNSSFVDYPNGAGSLQGEGTAQQWMRMAWW